MEDLPTPDIEAYVGGNQQACYVQLVDVLSALPAGEENTDVGRAFAFEVASKVGARYCCITRHAYPHAALVGVCAQATCCVLRVFCVLYNSPAFGSGYFPYHPLLEETELLSQSDRF